MKKMWNTPKMYDLSVDKTQGSPIEHRGHDNVFVDAVFTIYGQEWHLDVELFAS